jgi:hypothetical protein
LIGDFNAVAGGFLGLTHAVHLSPEEQVVIRIRWCLILLGGTDQLPDLLHGQDTGKFTWFFAQTVIDANFLLDHVLVEKSQSG